MANEQQNDDNNAISLGSGVNIVPERSGPDDVVLEALDESGEHPASTRDVAKKLRERIEMLTKEKQEYLEGWQRLKADFANYKRREEEAKGDFVKFAKEELVAELVPVLESFQLAFRNKEAWEKVDKNWRTGVEYIHNQLMGTLSEHGLSVDDPRGDIFDPNKHTSVGTVETKDQRLLHHIAEVVQVGYLLNSKVIRTPRVKVYAEVTTDARSGVE